MLNRGHCQYGSLLVVYLSCGRVRKARGEGRYVRSPRGCLVYLCVQESRFGTQLFRRQCPGGHVLFLYARKGGQDHVCPRVLSASLEPAEVEQTELRYPASCRVQGQLSQLTVGLQVLQNVRVQYLKSAFAHALPEL